MRRLLTLTLLLTLASTAGAQAKPLLGIADQKPETFLDSRLTDLQLGHARLYVPWDVLDDPRALAATDDWLANAQAVGMEPLITIAGSRLADRRGFTPGPKRLVAEFKRWRDRWPGQINTVSTWNEANLGKKPEVIARLWLALRASCRGCTVLGADLLDEPRVTQWTKRFVKAARRRPEAWGLHAYIDANTFSTRATRTFLKTVKGDLWLTETGGVADRARPVFPFAGCGIEHQTKATAFLLTRIARVSPRIKRIYLYNWDVGDGNGSFDAALVDGPDKERPALNVVRAYLGLPPSQNPKTTALAREPCNPGKPTKTSNAAAKPKTGNSTRR